MIFVKAMLGDKVGLPEYRRSKENEEICKDDLHRMINDVLEKLI
jgi:hypothetical protein